MADPKFLRGAWFNIGLVGLVAGCLLYEHGIATGSRMAFGFIYFVVLFRSGIFLSMGFLLGNMAFARIDLAALTVIPVYLVSSVLAGWPGLFFLSFVGTVGGLFVGAVSGFASPYHRWR